MVSGNVGLENIMKAHSEQKALALPALHAFLGTDNVEKFNRIDKTKWFKAFMKSSNDVIDAMIERKDVTKKQLTVPESFVCDTHSPKEAYIDKYV